MKIVQPYAKILYSAGLPYALSQIEYAARVSHRSEDAMTENSTKRFLEAVVIKHGDWSVVEHVSASVEMLVDRGITHEIVRHRIASYTQESTRFVNYVKKMPPSFIYPIPEVKCEQCLSGDEPYYYEPHERDSTNDIEGMDKGWYHRVDRPAQCHSIPCPINGAWRNSINQAETYYKVLLNDGWRPQEARSVFPNALASKIIVTMNLRSWRHFFLMRTTKEAHPQMRQISIPLLQEFKKLVPVLFDDIEPNATQIENLKKGR